MAKFIVKTNTETGLIEVEGSKKVDKVLSKAINLLVEIQEFDENAAHAVLSSMVIA